MKKAIHVLPATRKGRSSRLKAGKHKSSSRKRRPGFKKRTSKAKKKTASATGSSHGSVWMLASPSHYSTPLGTYASKQRAIDEALRRTRNVIVHGRSGQIIQKTRAKSSLNAASLRRAIRKILAKK